MRTAAGWASIAGRIPWGRGSLPVLAGLFVLVRVAEAVGSPPGWVRWYLDDVLCLPLVLATVLAGHRLAGRDAHWCLPLSHGVVALVSYGIFFEFLLPHLVTASVADPVDLVMYALGLALFQGLINRPGCGFGPSCRSSGLENQPWPTAVNP